LKVKKTFEGNLALNNEKCPEGCQDCIDVCPITGTLFLGEDGKVHVNELSCTYCGACKVVCPVDEALTVKRGKISHEPVHSGTWNKALERITSPVDAVKELKATAGQKRHDVVARRLAKEYAQ
jgi:MinD superfamily P-loop ATPase